MKGDNYWTGRHFWVHFWCGLVVGGGLGAWISWGMFANPWACAALALALAIVFALCAAKWGDPFWHFVMKHWT